MRSGRFARWRLGAVRLLIGGAVLATGPLVWGQAATLPEGAMVPVPGSVNGPSSLGPLPGLGGGTFTDQPPGAGEILGGRPGVATPRVPRSISDPGLGAAPLNPNPILAVPRIPALTEVPLFGNLELAEGDDPGPPDGLTFPAAVDLLLKRNLDLAARRFEIPLAQADILTASLRANPIFYADSQLVPYGNYTPNRPGGQTQYDVNISQPIDFSRKRRARTAVAVQAKRATEAQLQDAIRLQIGNLATAYVSVLAARETVRYVETGLKGLDGVLDATRRQAPLGNRNSADVARITAQRGAAAVGLLDAEEALRRARRTLGTLLNLRPDEAEAIQLRATIRDDAPEPPGVDALIGMALQCRPDVVAYRIGVGYANASLNLQKANRYADAYLLYQPYTFQNNSPTGQKSAYSYALGLTVPLPLVNRNQGNIERARVNIEQTKTQLTAIERQVVTEVVQAEREYRTTRDYLARLEADVLPAARKAVADTRLLFQEGEIADVTQLLNVQRESNDIVRQYRDTAVRHRRSMYNLNTVVGQCIFP